MSNETLTIETFLIQYPVFDSTDTTLVESTLDFNIRLFSKADWGDFYSDAVGFATAHELSLSLQALSNPSGAFQGAVGVVNSISAAGVSTSFSQLDWGVTKSDLWYSRTIYGQRYLRLRDNVMAPGAMAC